LKTAQGLGKSRYELWSTFALRKGLDVQHTKCFEANCSSNSAQNLEHFMQPECSLPSLQKACSEEDLVYPFPSYFFKIHFNIII
jgi:hypothetical protein